MLLNIIHNIINFIILSAETPVFGFVMPNVTVAEDVGTYLQNVTLFVPSDKKDLFGAFNFDVLSVGISASVLK